MVNPTDVHSLSDFKRNTTEHLTRLHKTGNPEVLTVNGSAKVVVQDANAYQEQMKMLEFFKTKKAIQEGIDSLDRGEGIPAEQVFAKLREKYGLKKEQ